MKTGLWLRLIPDQGLEHLGIKLSSTKGVVEIHSGVSWTLAGQR